MPAETEGVIIAAAMDTTAEAAFSLKEHTADANAGAWTPAQVAAARAASAALDAAWDALNAYTAVCGVDLPNRHDDTAPPDKDEDEDEDEDIPEHILKKQHTERFGWRKKGFCPDDGQMRRVGEVWYCRHGEFMGQFIGLQREIVLTRVG